MAQSCQYFTHKEENKSHSRVFFSSSVLLLINHWNSCSSRRGLFDINSISHNRISIQTPLPTSFLGVSATRPYGARDRTGRREPWERGYPISNFFPQTSRIPIFFHFSLVSKYTLISSFCLDTSLLTCQCLNIPYHINFPQVSRIPLIFHVSIPVIPYRLSLQTLTTTRPRKTFDQIAVCMLDGRCTGTTPAYLSSYPVFL